MPARVIIDNSGNSGAIVTGRLLEESNGNVHSTRGMNSATGEYVDLIAAGIIDPVKVVRTALSDAAGVASLMTTTECVIVQCDKPKEGEKSTATPGLSSYQAGQSGMDF